MTNNVLSVIVCLDYLDHQDRLERMAILDFQAQWVHKVLLVPLEPKVKSVNSLEDPEDGLHTRNCQVAMAMPKSLL